MHSLGAVVSHLSASNIANNLLLTDDSLGTTGGEFGTALKAMRQAAVLPVYPDPCLAKHNGDCVRYKDNGSLLTRPKGAEEGAILKLVDCLVQSEARAMANQAEIVALQTKLEEASGRYAPSDKTAEDLTRLASCSQRCASKDSQILSLTGAKQELETTVAGLQKKLSAATDAEKHWREQAYKQSQFQTPGDAKDILAQSQSRVAELEEKLSECYRQLVASRNGMPLATPQYGYSIEEKDFRNQFRTVVSAPSPEIFPMEYEEKTLYGF
ncbi:hypothetical protein D9611_010015 [Ephemerocybe angulata]|uniref:Uncharacterized protein n=1 Tax=Ephemerocybe angulata TaxID=980116 RepID=A0A8H5C6P2_9AGAR|nr:hypothetical protein D9611_010015 [Tulosesus angulatus]